MNESNFHRNHRRDGGNTPITLAQSVQDYLVHLNRVRNLEANTIHHYAHDLKLFVRFVERIEGRRAHELAASRIAPFHAIAFIDDQTVRKGNAPSSNRRRLSCLRGFYAYLARLGYISHAEIRTEMPKAPMISPVTLTAEEEIALLKAVRATSAFPIRDEAIFLLFLRCGLRLSELLQLRTHDFDPATSTLRVGRPRRSLRTITIPKEVRRALLRYLLNRAIVKSDRLFLNRYGRPMTKGAVYHALRRCLAAAGIRRKGITIQALRDTCLKRWIDEGRMPREDISKIAGNKRDATYRFRHQNSKNRQEES